MPPSNGIASGCAQNLMEREAPWNNSNVAKILAGVALLLGILFYPETTGHHFRHVISFSHVVCYKRNIWGWNLSITIDIISALWIVMAWCIRASVVIVPRVPTHTSTSAYDLMCSFVVFQFRYSDHNTTTLENIDPAWKWDCNRD